MSADPYLIPGTDVFRKILGIENTSDLQKAETEFSSIRPAQLVIEPIVGSFDFQHLKDIHQHLFQDVYDWAGESRVVEISKVNSFAPVKNISSFGEYVFNKLADEHHLKGLSRNQFVDRAACHLGEINAHQPFSDGNGRAQRAFFDHLAWHLNRAFNWGNVTAREMIEASIHCFTVDHSKMSVVLGKALLD